MATTAPDLGQGIYTFPEASRIITRGQSRVTPAKMRYWMSTGLTPPSHRADGRPLLSFVDLVSLEIVRRLLSMGASLHRVRMLERGLREEHPDLERPFAHNLFWTNGVDLWVSQEPGDPDPRFLREVVGERRGHYVWTEVVGSFAEEVRYGGPDEQADLWTVDDWVEINPAIQFGAPIVRGTRIPVRTIEANLRSGTPDEVAEWYGLATVQVEGVRDYLAAA